MPVAFGPAAQMPFEKLPPELRDKVQSIARIADIALVIIFHVYHIFHSFHIFWGRYCSYP